MQSIRKTAVSGQFYPEDKEELEKSIDFFLNQIPDDYVFPSGIKALIVPHASYYYSGLTATWSYKSISDKKVNRVILLGDSHSLAFSGLALSEDSHWESPLGLIPIDKNLNKKIKKEVSFSEFNNSAHNFDHILEVQLAFLQKILKTDFYILPLILGQISSKNCDSLANFLKENIKEDDLIIVSSDLSHYPSGPEAERIDQKTLDIIREKDVSLLESHIQEVMNSQIENQETLVCSLKSVKTLMILAEKMSWKGKILNYKHSGNISGDNSKVVGYGSLVFY